MVTSPIGELLGGLGLRPPHPGPDPGDELLGLERLDDVVVGAGLQAQHDVDGVGLRREHDDRHARLGADRPADVDAVHAGEHEVEQHDVRPQVPHGRQRPRAVADHGGVESLTPQHDGQHLGQCRVVVDHQYARLHARQYPTSPRQSVAETPCASRLSWSGHPGLGRAASRVDAPRPRAEHRPRREPARRGELRGRPRRCAPAGRVGLVAVAVRPGSVRSRCAARSAATARRHVEQQVPVGDGHAEPADLQVAHPGHERARRRPGAAAPRRRRRWRRRSGRRATRSCFGQRGPQPVRGGPAVEREQHGHRVHRVGEVAEPPVQGVARQLGVHVGVVAREGERGRARAAARPGRRAGGR